MTFRGFFAIHRSAPSLLKTAAGIASVENEGFGIEFRYAIKLFDEYIWGDCSRSIHVLLR
jgi:hypothetical protein